MKNAIVTSLAAAVLATAASAQCINVTIAGGWTVTPISPVVNSQAISQTNPTGQGSISGGVLASTGTCKVDSAGAQVGTNGSTRGKGSVQGSSTGGATVSGSASRTAGMTEFYNKSAGNGTVLVTLSAQPETPISVVRGSGYSGTATGNVAVTCPLFGWLTASASATAVAPPAIGTTQTIPVSASALAFNQNAFRLNLNSSGIANGTLPAASGMQLVAAANATGTVTLN